MMSENSKIEWTHHTFNPWWGCAKVSPGCDHCYAERDAGRFTPDKILWGVDAERREFGDKHWNEPLKWDKKAAAAGERHRVFCASMADVFDKNAPTGARQRLLSLIADTPNLDWLLLTKRIGNAARMLNDACQHDGRLMDANDRYRPLPNLWLGASIVNQEEADRDIPKLLQVPAAVRFLSMEPLLGPVDLRRHVWKCCGNPIEGHPGDGWMTPPDPPACCNEPDRSDLDWVIVGGESGPKARPMHPDWAYNLRDQCVEAGVPFLFKQWGEWANPGCLAFLTSYGEVRHIRSDGSFWDHAPKDENADALTVVRVGKKAAGRDLARRTYDEFPKGQA
jgi:protein gp37